MVFLVIIAILPGKFLRDKKTRIIKKRGDLILKVGQIALIGMISHVVFIYLTWRVIIAINFEPIIRKGRSSEGKIFIFLITIVIGTSISRFFLDILLWSQDLIYLF